MLSPIHLVSSKSFKGRNLTGTQRLVHDLAVDIHKNIQHWNDLHSQGFAYLKEIKREKRDESYSEALQDLCDKLENICDDLDVVVGNLDQIKHQLTTVPGLHKTVDKLFVTWPITKFGEVAETIHKAYHMEAKLKRKLVENVAHNHTESSKMLHIAAWVYEPSLTEDLTILLESFLNEVGLR
ncbi:PREDICTED: cyclin-dependent kinase 2-interacting protein-like [Vollenhovia emeryi]|uniref:cyclin-dependent kinase 2-interacting protein-like n=1 Tax=Vollenhovia emeryi TaxID=411798 RepID=UPI0005F55A13|nr:PREDICTED: cyclin-dependent kinase 2-interacting protein-like [Vollenhovia emeryi]